MPLLHSKCRALALILVFATLLGALELSAAAVPPAMDAAPATAQGKRGLANPASENCVRLGGTLDIRTRPDGGQYGVCVFEDNRQCEEWALLRGQCPEGGLKITGYDDEAQIYCAITGGEVDMQAGVCQRADGRRCPLQANFSGRCPRP
jgi:putative hemolysin